MLNVRNVLNDAERAKDKKAPIGVDVTIENFSDEIIDGIDLLDDLDDVSKLLCGGMTLVEHPNHHDSYLKLNRLGYIDDSWTATV